MKLVQCSWPALVLMVACSAAAPPAGGVSTSEVLVTGAAKTTASPSAPASVSKAESCRWVLQTFGAVDGSLHTQRYGFEEGAINTVLPVTEGEPEANAATLEAMQQSFESGRSQLEGSLRADAEAFASAAKTRATRLRAYAALGRLPVPAREAGGRRHR